MGLKEYATNVPNYFISLTFHFLQIFLISVQFLMASQLNRLSHPITLSFPANCHFRML